MQSRSFASVLIAAAILSGAGMPHRALAQEYVFTTLAGIAGQVAENDGVVDNARFRFPRSLCIDAAGTLFVTDSLRGETYFRETVRKITPTGAVTTVYRHPELTFWFNGVVVEELSSRFNGIAVDADGNLYVTNRHAVYRVSPAGEFTLVAGSLRISGFVDQPGPEARFSAPVGLAVDAAGRIFVADYLNAAIRMITPDGDVSTVADLSNLSRPENPFGSSVIDGVTYPDFHGPQQIALDAAGDLIVLDLVEDAFGYGPFQYGVWKLRKNPSGHRWSQPSLVLPYGEDDVRAMTMDRTGTLYVTSSRQPRSIMRLTPAQIAGEHPVAPQYTDDPEGPEPRPFFLPSPRHIAVDTTGNIYLAEAGLQAIRKGIALTGREPDARIVNVSVRTPLVRGDALVAFFNLRGAPGPALFRGIGPGLASLMPGIVPARDLWLDFGSGSVTPSFDGIGQNFPLLQTAHATSGAFPLTAGDVAAVRDSSGSVLVQLATSGSEPGVAMLEWYDLGTQCSNRFNSVSLRREDSGAGLVMGLVIAGTEQKVLLFHAHTESENRQFDVSDVDNAVGLSVFDSQGHRVGESKSSSSALTPLLIRMGTLAPGERGESTLVLALPPGSYTLQANRLIGVPGEITLAVFEAR